MYRCLQRPEENIRSHENRVTGSCEPCDIVLGTELKCPGRVVYTPNHQANSPSAADGIF